MATNDRRPVGEAGVTGCRGVGEWLDRVAVGIVQGRNRDAKRRDLEPIAHWRPDGLCIRFSPVPSSSLRRQRSGQGRGDSRSCSSGPGTEPSSAGVSPREEEPAESRSGLRQAAHATCRWRSAPTRTSYGQPDEARPPATEHLPSRSHPRIAPPVVPCAISEESRQSRLALQRFERPRLWCISHAAPLNQAVAVTQYGVFLSARGEAPSRALP